MTSEFLHVGFASVAETTYLVVSLKNGAPGSSSTVRVDHAGSNISKVVRPSRMPRQRSVTAPMASPIWGSKPYSNVHVGASITPSRLMNSCTCICPTCHLFVSNAALTDAAGWANSSLRLRRDPRAQSERGERRGQQQGRQAHSEPPARRDVEARDGVVQEVDAGHALQLARSVVG